MLNEGSNRNVMPKRKYWILFPVVFILAVLVLGWLVMFLWNAILPDVVGTKPLNYQQALGLLVLCRILCGGFRGGGQHGSGFRGGFGKGRRNRWMNMTEDERAQFKASWEERCRKRD